MVDDNVMTVMTVAPEIAVTWPIVIKLLMCVCMNKINPSFRTTYKDIVISVINVSSSILTTLGSHSYTHT
jgi:hypothetical protein